ncbi:exosortase-associated EpsI family protein [Fimbriiglobus ruber]|uniref:Methanolan biosynthesis EpsI domain-containing protein n=1 Tax=Fimbriiglobus ruber TaxID=1908690 RepID=A0A225EBY4_9BACT|nr:exosortase-associated EpsI family protein [Fimbriiglobus ruber]OWK47516.1 hypothetical protein FRUB_01215 [Fimbriiglobus ruber]
MGRVWPVAVVVVVFAAVGVYSLKPQAGKAEAAVSIQTRLDQIPLAVGPWTGTPVVVPEKQLRIAEAQAHLSRSYLRSDNRASVGVLVLYGEPGPLGAHTPEVCYEGAGFRGLGSPYKYSPANDPSEFWTTRFETGGYPPAVVQVMWGWSTDGVVWKAAESPRLDFAGHARIFKLYLSRDVQPGAAVERDKDPTGGFLALFAKELQTAVSSPGHPPPAGSSEK